MLFYTKKITRLTLICIGLSFFISCTSSQKKNNSTGNADTSEWLLPFNKVDSVNPVMQPGNLTFSCPIQHKAIKWEAKNVFNPAIAVRNDTLFMLYRAQDSNGCSRIGLAKSVDGIHFARDSSPVLYP